MDRNRQPKGESSFWAIVVLLACFFLVSLSALFAAPPYQLDATAQYQQRLKLFSASKMNISTSTYYDIASLVGGAADIPRGSKSYSFYNAGSTECWVSLSETNTEANLSLWMGQGGTARNGEDRWRLVRAGQSYNVAFTSQRIGVAPAQGSTCDFDHDLRW